MKRRFLFGIIILTLLFGCSSQKEISSSSFDPIEASFRSIADSLDYDFDPTSVISEENRIEDGDSFRAMNYDEVVEYSKNAPGVDEDYLDENGRKLNVFMKFDGYYRDGYSGKTIIYEAHLTLWENGVFTASVTDEAEDRHGVWYNTLNKTSDSRLDSLKLVYPKHKTVVSGSSKELTEIVCSKESDTGYSWSGSLPFETKNKEDNILISGYYYYPEIGIYVRDNGVTTFKLSRLESSIANTWDTLLVLSNLHTLILEDRVSYEVVKYEIEDIDTPGTKVVTVRYKDYSIEKTIEVVDGAQ